MPVPEFSIASGGTSNSASIPPTTYGPLENALLPTLQVFTLLVGKCRLFVQMVSPVIGRPMRMLLMAGQMISMRGTTLDITLVHVVVVLLICLKVIGI